MVNRRAYTASRIPIYFGVPDLRASSSCCSSILHYHSLVTSYESSWEELRATEACVLLETGFSGLKDQTYQKAARPEGVDSSVAAQVPRPHKGATEPLPSRPQHRLSDRKIPDENATRGFSKDLETRLGSLKHCRWLIVVWQVPGPVLLPFCSEPPPAGLPPKPAPIEK